MSHLDQYALKGNAVEERLLAPFAKEKERADRN
jgi:hypothetical protein